MMNFNSSGGSEEREADRLIKDEIDQMPSGNFPSFLLIHLFPIQTKIKIASNPKSLVKKITKD